MNRPVAGIVLLGVALGLLAQTQGPIQPRAPKPPSPPKDEVPIGEPASKKEAQPEPPPPAPKEPICAKDFEDPGRPVMKRGSSQRASKPLCEELAVPISGRPLSDGEEAAGAPPLTLYDKVRIRASDYTDQLPNFICEQLIRRSQSSNSGKTWKHRDTVMVEVMMVDGKEDYGNVRRNNRKVEWQKVKETGTWSLGEYGTILIDILHPATNAAFTKRGEDKIGTQVLEVHDYLVQKENSHWKVDFEGRRYQPKYRGALWIDPKDHMVHRIEMESLNMPADYPVRHAEMILQYGPVKIGEEWYLLPLHSENLACFAGTSNCTKNEIDFRNYRKFSTESNVSTTESTITFDGEEKAPRKKK